MADYIRRIVSGNKARFKDGNLNLELDLVYLTERIIIMGYPAEGFESFYRNNRDDAKRFLEHRHGKNFWVFNFCPIRENSYPASFFDGRVSRYPFPDHHAPPLAVMPLVAREMADWLDGGPERVAVLHCKAGKGRSGTMACTYLLSLEQPPSLTGPQRASVPDPSEWAQIHADDVMESVEHLEDAKLPPIDLEKSTSSASASDGVDPSKTFTDALQTVLDLHTARRMQPTAPNAKQKQGVSIPSQRRWLHYWALLLARAQPTFLWTSPVSPPAQRPKVRLTQITVRMREASALRMNVVRAASAVLDRVGRGKSGSAQARAAPGGGLMWISLARYDDSFVGLLEGWEQHTRDEGHMGRMRAGAGPLEGESLKEVFDDRGRWDKTKMVRSFARMGATSEDSVRKASTEDGKMWTYKLTPLTESGWVNIRTAVQEDESQTEDLNVDIPASEVNSLHDLTQSSTGRGVVLDAGREVRVKVYMGQIFICWLWLIPAFHMPPPPPGPSSHSRPSSSPSSAPSSPQAPTKFMLTRKQVDFPIGLGSALVDIEIEMEWLQAAESARLQPPAATSGEALPEPGGIAAKIEAAAAGSVEDAVDAKQAADE